AHGDGIVVAGSVTTAGGDVRPAVVRLKGDGSTDTAFGLGGTKLIDLISGHQALPWPFTFGGVSVQPDRKIVLTGTPWRPNDNAAEIAVIRLNANGSLDTSFGQDYDHDGTRDGMTFLYVAEQPFFSSEMSGGFAFQADGKMLVAGWSNRISGNMLVFR